MPDFSVVLDWAVGVFFVVSVWLGPSYVRQRALREKGVRVLGWVVSRWRTSENFKTYQVKFRTGEGEEVRFKTLGTEAEYVVDTSLPVVYDSRHPKRAMLEVHLNEGKFSRAVLWTAVPLLVLCGVGRIALLFTG
ncbi:DUF3592 domain-containing protein [Streptomyces sp. NPDC059740]|uniref:DUF3592 domain-containing protein n=1 Tax=Streptomyces sp. NPDC059740 TaxID=3346926 RepID=UPI003660D70E